jgi:hypothetical protein
VDLARFAFWFILLALPIALLTGFLLCQLFLVGFYLIGVAPLIAGLLTGGGVALAVHLGRCRNRWVGAAAGLLAGLVMYLGYYQFHFASLFGYRHVHRVDVLPRWVYFRVLTDEQRKVGDFRDRAGGRNNLGVVDQVFKWVFFAMDATAALIPPFGVGWALASRPFSERHRRWMKTHTTRVMPAVADVILTGLTGAGKVAFAERLRPAITVPPEMAAELRFNYLPDEIDAPIYLTVAQLVFSGKKNQPPAQRVVMNRELLDADEARVIAAAVNLPRTGEATRSLPPAAALAEHVSGRVVPLPPEEAGKIDTRGFVLRANLVQLAPLLLALIVGASLGVLAYLRWDDWPPLALRSLIGVAVVVGVGLLIFQVRYELFLATNYHHRRVLSVLSGRAESFVDPDDPEAVFVEVIPRAHWGKLMAQNATDVGLLKVDRQRRAVLFEGDRERWVVPAESLLACEVEEYLAVGQEANQYNARALVVLVANIDGRPWEAPVCPQNTAFRPWTIGLRRQLAKELHTAIGEILPPKGERA